MGIATRTKSTGSLPVDDVRSEARGRWLEIIERLCPQLNMSVRFDTHRPCPVHGGTDGFRFFADARQTGGGICNTCGSKPDGFAIIMWINGWDFRRTVREVMTELGYRDDSTNAGGQRTQTRAAGPRVAPTTGSVMDEQRAKARLALMNRIWNEATPLFTLDAESLPARYYRSRGIDWTVAKLQRALRFHRSLEYRGRGLEPDRVLPAILARFVLPSGRPVNFHRTFLEPDEPVKARVLEPKRMMPKVEAPNGGAIRLKGSRSLDVVNVCEGLETGLSILQGSMLDTYVCTTGTLLEAFVPPPDRRVLIWADADLPKVVKPNSPPERCGEKKARVLLERLQAMGVTAAIRFPFVPATDKGVDWNDIHKDYGDDGILAGLYNDPHMLVH